MTEFECDVCGAEFDPADDRHGNVKHNVRTGERISATCGTCMKRHARVADVHTDPVKRGGDGA